MLYTNIKISLRILFRNKIFTIINIVGLSFGITASLVLFIWTNNELSYDKFHEDYETIYRLEREVFWNGKWIFLPTTSGPFGPVSKNEISDILNYTRLFQTEFEVVNDKNNYSREKVLVTDSCFFTIFSYTFISGNPEEALKQPNSIIIDEDAAFKYFGEKIAMGKIIPIKIDNKVQPFEVTGIIKEMPDNSHFHSQFIIPITSLNQPYSTYIDSWISNFLYTYVKIRKKTNISTIESLLDSIVKKHMSESVRNFFKIEDINDYIKIHLNPIHKIHLHSTSNTELEKGGSITSVYIFSVISFLLIIIACINFINLSTARASKRALEVGIRKTLGAKKHNLIMQYITESLLISLSAIILALLLFELLIPHINIITGKEFTSKLLFQSRNLIMLFTIWLLTGVISGLYPAFILSTFEPLKVLKGRIQYSRGGAFRRILVAFQLTTTISLIIITLSINKQVGFLLNKDIGYNPNKLININTDIDNNNLTKFTALKNELLTNPKISNFCTVSTIPSEGSLGDSMFQIVGSNNNVGLFKNESDSAFFSTFEIKLVAGRNFQHTKGIIEYIVNEAAVIKLGFNNPEEVIGIKIANLDRNGELHNQGIIVGVSKNFHFMSLHRNIDGLIIQNQISSIRNIVIKYKDLGNNDVLDLLKTTWGKHFPERIFSHTFVYDQYKDLNKEEIRFRTILLYFTILSMLVASLGLIGLFIFEAEKKRKEIAIRKVLGACTSHIINRTTRELNILFGISTFLAIPLASYLTWLWLQNFAYKISFPISTIIYAPILSYLFSLTTITYLIYNIVRTNPVSNLREE